LQHTTGAAKGIGEAAALGFAKEGAQLLLTDLDAAAVEQAAARCRQAGSPKVAVLAGDITAADAAARIADKLQVHFMAAPDAVLPRPAWQQR
jgi:short-subunit dehydrogenase